VKEFAQPGADMLLCSGLAPVTRSRLAVGFDFALSRPVTRPREEDHGKEDGNQKRFTVVHDKNR
jgi:hypothetical protein